MHFWHSCCYILVTYCSCMYLYLMRKCKMRFWVLRNFLSVHMKWLFCKQLSCPLLFFSTDRASQALLELISSQTNFVHIFDCIFEFIGTFKYCAFFSYFPVLFLPYAFSISSQNLRVIFLVFSKWQDSKLKKKSICVVVFFRLGFSIKKPAWMLSQLGTWRRHCLLFSMH